MGPIVYHIVHFVPLLPRGVNDRLTKHLIVTAQLDHQNHATEPDQLFHQMMMLSSLPRPLVFHWYLNQSLIPKLTDFIQTEKWNVGVKEFVPSFGGKVNK